MNNEKGIKMENIKTSNLFRIRNILIKINVIPSKKRNTLDKTIIKINNLIYARLRNLV